MTEVRVTRRTARILRVLLQIHELRKTRGKHFHVENREVMYRARVSAGTFYPVITRLEANGWVKEVEEKEQEGDTRPPRTFLHLTTAGVILARAAVAEDEARAPVWQRMWRRT